MLYTYIYLYCHVWCEEDQGASNEKKLHWPFETSLVIMGENNGPPFTTSAEMYGAFQLGSHDAERRQSLGLL